MIIVILFQLRIFCASVKFKHIVQLLFASMAEQKTSFHIVWTSTLSAFNPVKLTYSPISNSIIENTFYFLETYIPKSRGNGFLSC